MVAEDFDWTVMDLGVGAQGYLVRVSFDGFLPQWPGYLPCQTMRIEVEHQSKPMEDLHQCSTEVVGDNATVDTSLSMKAHKLKTCRSMTACWLTEDGHYVD